MKIAPIKTWEDFNSLGPKGVARLYSVKVNESTQDHSDHSDCQSSIEMSPSSVLVLASFSSGLLLRMLFQESHRALFVDQVPPPIFAGACAFFDEIDHLRGRK